MIETVPLEHPALAARVTLHEPEHGWSREAYEQTLNTYVDAHGRAPQTVTMHPETAVALGLSETIGDSTATDNVPFLVTSPDYDRQTIVWYY